MGVRICMLYLLWTWLWSIRHSCLDVLEGACLSCLALTYCHQCVDIVHDFHLYIDVCGMHVGFFTLGCVLEGVIQLWYMSVIRFGRVT